MEKEKRKIYCPNCDEWDGVKYYGHNQQELRFICDFCYKEIDEPYEITYEREELIPDHIPRYQWNKYIAKTIYIRNKYWYK